MAAAALTSPGLHASRFHVTVYSNTPDLAEARVAEQQSEDFGFEVGLLDSLPWSREHRPQALPDSQGGAENPGVAADLQEEGVNTTDTLTSAAQEGATLTARVAKSLSQLRMSASGSSANFRSLDCNCCNDYSPDCGACGVGEMRPDEPSPGEEPQHLEPPWSHNSCSWSRRSQCSRECSSSASLHQLAMAHRSERVGCRAFHRKASFTNSSNSHVCLPDCGDYLVDLQDRVQLWLSQVESDPSEGAKFFLGHPDS